MQEMRRCKRGELVAPAYCHERASRPRCRMGGPGWSPADSLSWRGVESSQDERMGKKLTELSMQDEELLKRVQQSSGPAWSARQYTLRCTPSFPTCLIKVPSHLGCHLWRLPGLGSFRRVSRSLEYDGALSWAEKGICHTGLWLCVWVYIYIIY